MQYNQGRSRSTTIASMLGLAIALSMGVGDRTWGAIAGFEPPSNVVAEVSPELYKYELQRIGIIGFVNNSGTPDAGIRLAHSFIRN